MKQDKQQPIPHVIIHGHFYQPPREDPWSGEIHKQVSAYPYHDWNARITDECYGPNAESRVLDEEGRIKAIINNYAYMSFNFGPTLFSWMEKHAPYIYELILEADKQSAALNNGHGNAIAQVYNHAIMPLCNIRDMDTQIIWGIEDFVHRFNRPPEGIWLSETAINQQVVVRLVQHGIKFIILSPAQAYKVYDPESHKEHDVQNNSIDTSRAYHIQTSQGSLNCFFYNMPLSQGISFEHLLHNASHFKQALLGQVRNKENPGLVIAATDGETYGHHEAFGDMCFASLVYENQHNPEFILTNPGNYLETFPTHWEAELKPGKGTSWSCMHGVGRWMEDCGCSTGGRPDWNQKWRKPFRDALDYLRDAIIKIYERETSDYFNDPWAARNDYIQLLVTPTVEKRKQFFETYGKAPLSESIQRDMLVLLESQKFAMFMYTSCAWFFSELSGIETVQNLRYAKRAMDLASHFFAPIEELIPNEFKKRLGKAKSNISEFHDGEWIYQHMVAESQWSKEKILYYFLLSEIVGKMKQDNLLSYHKEEAEIFYFRFAGLDIHSIQQQQSVWYYGFVTMYDAILHQALDYSFFVQDSPSKPLVAFIKHQLEPYHRETMEQILLKSSEERIDVRLSEWSRHRLMLMDLPQEQLQSLFETIYKPEWNVIIFSEGEQATGTLERYKTGERLIQRYELCQVEFSEDQIQFLSALFTRMLHDLDQQRYLKWNEETLVLIENYLEIAQKKKWNINIGLLSNLFEQETDRILDALSLSKPISQEYFQLLEMHLDFANRIQNLFQGNSSQLTFNRRKAETLVFNYMLDFIKDPQSSTLEKEDYAELYRLAEKLNISITHFPAPK